MAVRVAAEGVVVVAVQYTLFPEVMSPATAVSSVTPAVATELLAQSESESTGYSQSFDFNQVPILS